MKMDWNSYLRCQRAAALVVLLAVMGVMSCGRNGRQEPVDHPRLTPEVKMLDVTFHSDALNRDMQYRAVIPAALVPGQKLPVLYLLHGGGGGFRDWSNDSDVSGYALRGLILVMPEGNSSYYMNSFGHPQDRYEDYIVRDVIADAERRLPIAGGRAHRAIAGNSMGGFGAIVLALKHPDLFVFAGGLSSALDVPSRPFSIKRVGQWWEYRSIFGPWGSQTRRGSDPFRLVRAADPAQTSYMFLTCGEQEGLLPANRKFAALLQERKFLYEYHTVRGGHDWNQWNGHVPDLIESVMKHLGRN
jgi:S-formylglutathione hydrolase FrmB